MGSLVSRYVKTKLYCEYFGLKILLFGGNNIPNVRP